MRRSSLVVLLLLSPCIVARAQQSPCKLEMPVTVMLPDGSLIQKLGINGFIARDKQALIPIGALTADVGPRRIIFVVENGKRVPEAARKIEVTVISDLLTNAREIDSFALLTSTGPRRELPFSSSREALKAALKDLDKPTQAKNRPYQVLEAVLQAAGWFQQPQPGDSILLMTMGTESDQTTRFSKVEAALAAARIRLFGINLGMRIAGSFDSSLLFGPRGMVSSSGGIYPNRESLFALSAHSGGFALAENAAGDPWQEYKLTDTRLRELTDLAWQMYKAITEYCHLQLESPTINFELDLSDEIRKQLPRARVLYPKNPAGCAPKA
jgi:hypothetical protein